VVEADEPAWRDIVDEFGEKVLNDDRTIDREAPANTFCYSTLIMAIFFIT